MWLLFATARAGAPCALPEPLFGPLQLLHGGPAAVPADLDGDGDLDVVVAFDGVFDNGPGELWSFENLGGTFAAGVQFASTFAGEVVAVADLDADGDPDVLASGAQDGEVAWYENL